MDPFALPLGDIGSGAGVVALLGVAWQIARRGVADQLQARDVQITRLAYEVDVLVDRMIALDARLDQANALARDLVTLLQTALPQGDASTNRNPSADAQTRNVGE